MAKHVLLDNVTHKDLKINKVYAQGRGYDVSLTRVFPIEFGQLQMEYPLFFIKNRDTGDFEPIALLGFGDAENLYLTSDAWDAAYIPLSIERQPFLIGFQEQEQDGVPSQVPVVHVDLDDPSVGDTDGQPVFLAHGGESPFLERINSVLMAIHQGHEINKSFSQILVGLELVESVTLDFEFIDGSKQNLAGLYTVNEDKLRALNANGLDVLHRKGHLQDIYMMIASLPNMARLIARKNAQLKA